MQVTVSKRHSGRLQGCLFSLVEDANLPYSYMLIVFGLSSVGRLLVIGNVVKQ